MTLKLYELTNQYRLLLDKGDIYDMSLEWVRKALKEGLE